MNLTEMGKWSKRVRVELGGAYEEVVLRTIGDRSRALAGGQEAMERRLLEFRPESERFAALGEALRLAPKEELAALVAEGEREATRARLGRRRPDPVEPRQDIAAGESEKEFLARQERWQQECAQLAKTREAEVEARLAARKKELAEIAADELIELARAKRIDMECREAFREASDDWALFEATRRADDPAAAYFNDIEEVRGLHPEVKAQLAQAYCELDRGEADLPKG